MTMRSIGDIDPVEIIEIERRARALQAQVLRGLLHGAWLGLRRLVVGARVSGAGPATDPR